MLGSVTQLQQISALRLNVAQILKPFLVVFLIRCAGKFHLGVREKHVAVVFNLYKIERTF